MDRLITLILALSLCVFSGDFDGNGTVDFNDFAIFADNWLKGGRDGNDLADQNDLEAVMIVLTKLEVTDRTLELHYKIKNGSDHNVWVCDSLEVVSQFRFEVYLAEDNETLLIRRRFDVPTQLYWDAPPTSRYVRLSPGEERAESISLTLPVLPRRMFTAERPTAEYATRLALEIGFYNEDLPGMIRGILEVADKLYYANLDLDNCDPSIIERYFRGISVARYYGGLSSFNKYHPDVSEHILISYYCPVLKDEQVLRLALDDVSIPCKSG